MRSERKRGKWNTGTSSSLPSPGRAAGSRSRSLLWAGQPPAPRPGPHSLPKSTPSVPPHTAASHVCKTVPALFQCTILCSTPHVLPPRPSWPPDPMPWPSMLLHTQGLCSGPSAGCCSTGSGVLPCPSASPAAGEQWAPVYVRPEPPRADTSSRADAPTVFGQSCPQELFGQPSFLPTCGPWGPA